MAGKLNRKEFLRIGTGSTVGLLVSAFVKPAWSMDRKEAAPFAADTASASLITLDADPPLGTTAVRYYIDDVRISELTNLYALQTQTRPVWKTVVAPEWIGAGEHVLKIEADAPGGPVVLKQERVVFDGVKRNEGDLTGAWLFSDAADLPSGVAEGKNPAVAKKDYDDRGWLKVLVPNSLGYLDKKWNKSEGLLGVYKRRFTVSAPRKGEQFALVLQSCYWYGRVFVNGVEVGETKGGYLPARFDVTGALHAGGNTLTVIVDNRLETMGVFKRLHSFYWNWGGLLQEVSLERYPEVSVIEIRANGDARGGLRIWLTAVNATHETQNHKGIVEVFDAAGKKIAGAREFTVKVKPGGEIDAPLEMSVRNPDLWSLDSPALYTVVWTDSGRSLKERTGFRDVSAKGGDLLINGKVVGDLQGFDRHADYPGLGRTQSRGLVQREMKELYDKGFRIFRPAHYPTTPSELDAADELGMLVLEEINVTGLKGPQLNTEEVKSFGAAQLRRLIHRDRSHPSIFAWSVGNENLTDEEGAEAYVSHTIGVGRSLDDSRLFTHVTMRATRDKTFSYQDFVAQNYYAGWYTKDVNAITDLVDSVQRYAGNKPIMITEYGAEAVIGRVGITKGTEYYQSYVIEGHNRLLNGRAHFIGKLYWSSTEFWCRPGWPGGNPAPVPPFHVKALRGYYREQDKLGWRVIFSPVRISFDKPELKTTQFGCEMEVPAGKPAEIEATVRLDEVRGKAVNGNVIILPPLGFKPKKYSLPFTLEPHSSKEITFTLTGTLPDSLLTSDGFIKAVIDEQTEAHPLLLTVKAAGAH